MFWSAKNSVAIFSCQSLLLGTNIPNDTINWQLFCYPQTAGSQLLTSNIEKILSVDYGLQTQFWFKTVI